MSAPIRTVACKGAWKPKKMAKNLYKLLLWFISLDLVVENAMITTFFNVINHSFLMKSTTTLHSPYPQLSMRGTSIRSGEIIRSFAAPVSPDCATSISSRFRLFLLGKQPAEEIS